MVSGETCSCAVAAAADNGLVEDLLDSDLDSDADCAVDLPMASAAAAVAAAILLGAYCCHAGCCCS